MVTLFDEVVQLVGSFLASTRFRRGRLWDLTTSIPICRPTTKMWFARTTLTRTTVQGTNIALAKRTGLNGGMIRLPTTLFLEVAFIE